MLMTTTDTIPQRHAPLGLVAVQFVAAPPSLRGALLGPNVTGQLKKAEAALETEATQLGADAVIGIRVQSVFGNQNIMMGTAIKYVVE